jgi:spermidine synthase
MTTFLDRHDDGSLALYIDGDLQFDSRDERVYHEALALPAVALAMRRRGGPLKALICGGGDGLIARELLKSPVLARLDLVDYDPAIVELARADLTGLNGGSLDDPRTRVHAEDAWVFVERATAAGERYDLVIVDLTVPQDLDGARLQSVEWYAMLHGLLTPDGALAANAISPTALPDAYWSIYNSARAAGLHPRPYRIALPSFAAAGFGDDWGFVLAAPRPIAPPELDDDLPLPVPRAALHSPAQLRRLFRFPEHIAARRATALPARAGSAILLHYIHNGAEAGAAGPATWDGVAFEHDPAALPEPDDGQRLLPPEVRAALATPTSPPLDEQALLERVLRLMPALQRFQTREMIATFLEQPARFLATLDLPGLVERLLRRAADLPRHLVAELRLLRSKLRDLAHDPHALLHLGTRIVTIITLVIIMANLVYPDAIYGKGGSGGADATSGSSISRPIHGAYDSPAAPPELASDGGFRNSDLGRSTTVDESGSLFPVRRYRYYPRYYGRCG